MKYIKKVVAIFMVLMTIITILPLTAHAMEGDEVGRYTGTELSGQTSTIDGDTIKIQLVSDDSSNEWGFKVTSISKEIPEESVPETPSEPELPFEIDQDDFIYSVENGEATLVDYRGVEQVVVVPSEIQGYPVKRIKSLAFVNGVMKSLVISEGIEVIENEAIFNCLSLESISFPSTVSFSYLSEMGLSPLPLYCWNVKHIEVAKNHPDAVVVDNVLYDKDMKTLIYYPGGDPREVLVVPDGVVTIGNDACAYNSNLKEVRMPDTIKTIGYNAFFDDEFIETVTIPKNCEFIGQYAFGGTSIKELYLPQNVHTFMMEDTSMPMLEAIEVDQKNQTYYSVDGVLYAGDILIKYPGQKRGERFEVPEGTVRINDYAIGQVNELKEVVLPDSLEEIGDHAFMFSDNIEHIHIPENVFYIGSEAFWPHRADKGLKSITIPATVTHIEDNICLYTVVIYGEKGSAAETYALEYGNVFETDLTCGCEEEEPEPPEEPIGLPFIDVSEGKWFYNSVKWAYENGLLTGTSETTFDPNGQMTRGMLVTVLYRKEGRPVVAGNNKFPDVSNKKYYASSITWASSLGLVAGYKDGSFGPEDSITREQIAKILYLYADYKGFDTSNFADISSYKDAAKVSGYAKKYMEWAVAEGLIKGSNGELNPKGNATRAEIAAILKRFVERYEMQ